MVFSNFLGSGLFLVGPPPAGNSNLVGFWHILGLWIREIPGPGEKHENTISWCQEHFCRGENVTTLFGMVFRNFLGGDFFFGRTRTGRQ